MKKIICAILCIFLLASFSACGSNSVSGITVPDYKNIEVAAADVEVTDEDVEAYMQSFLDSLATTEEVTDGTVETGDTVNIDYTGYIDGETFEGGSATGADLTIGSNSFIDGFETGLIGQTKGNSVDLNLNFPDPYTNNEELSGKAVLFTVVINSITRTSTPELTDELILANLDYFENEELKTVEDAYDHIRTTLEKSTLGMKAFDVIIEKAEVTEYDEEGVTEMINELNEYYESYYSYYYSVDLDTYLSTMNYSREDFDSDIDEYVRKYFKEKMLVSYIAEEEGIKVSDKEYTEALEQYATQYGYASVDEYKENSSENELESYKVTLLYNKVIDYLAEITTVK